MHRQQQHTTSSATGRSLGSGEAAYRTAPYTGKRNRAASWLAGVCDCSGAFATSFNCPAPFADTSVSEALRMRLLRHCGIFQSDVGPCSRPSPSRSRSLPPTAPTRAREHAGRSMFSLIVLMSSGRLFLDRVARQHCPSPLHRRDQINMCSREVPTEHDISTLQGGRHFYFALTATTAGLNPAILSGTLPSCSHRASALI
jgi:hypothetical protein